MTTTAVPVDEKSRARHAAVRALALLPGSSTGRERDAFAAAVVEVIEEAGVPVDVVGGDGAGAAAVLSAAVRRARAEPPSHVLCLHPGLAPVALAAQRAAARSGGPPPQLLVFCSGADLGAGNLLSDLVLRRVPARVVATDSAAGAALSARFGPVELLRPGIDTEAFHELMSLTPSPAPSVTDPPQIMTLAPLDDAERSGALTVLRAAQLVRTHHAGLEVVVAGPGRPSPVLRDALSDRASWARALASTELSDLRAAYAKAHLFVLGTREGPSRRRRDPGDEFGLALVQAQVAGVPVVAPASGAAGDAFVEGVTGLRPTDPSPEALADCMRALLEDEAALQRASRNARLWATSNFLPERFAARVRQVVFGAAADPARLTPLAFVSPIP